MTRGANAWVDMNVGDLGKVVTGKTPSTSHPEYWGGGIPFVTPGDLLDGGVSVTARTVAESALSICKPLPRGTVLVSCIGTIGKTGILDCDVAITNQQINAIIPNPKVIDPWFLLYALLRSADALRKSASITTIPILNKSNFEAFDLPIADLPEQQIIARVLFRCDTKIAAIEHEIALLDELLRAMLEELMTGRLSAVPLVENEA